MAQDREVPCIYYECMGQCKKNKEANHWHLCQHCHLYVPRSKTKTKNLKKEKLYKIKKNEDRWE